MCETQVLEQAGRACTAHPAGADRQNRLLARDLRVACPELALWDQSRPGDHARVPLLWLAHIDDRQVWVAGLRMGVLDRPEIERGNAQAGRPPGGHAAR